MQAGAFVSVILVCWNSGKYLPRCLDSLEAQTFRDFEVVLVDNGSTDGSLDGLAEKYPRLKFQIEKLGRNQGFAAANNIGVRLASGAWAALLNTDAFPAPDWLETLTQAIARFGNQCVYASRQVQADLPSLLDGEGDVYHVSGLGWRMHYNFPVYTAGEPFRVFSACGATALLPREDFLAVGGFDEDYFAYHEDVDLGFRLRLRGLDCMLIPQAVVHHIGSASSGKASDFAIYHGHRNLVWTYFKDMPAPLLWLYLPLHLVMNLVFVLFFSAQGRAGVILRAKWDALLGLPSMLRKRGQAQGPGKGRAASIHAAMSRNWFAPLLVSRQRKKYLRSKDAMIQSREALDSK
ncbi:MAG: glycosyltransferase family 2 protein [Chloroflexi bacterium]|nr:glycosyltransferase family 2 protein [Chloroflexota bacterium]